MAKKVVVESVEERKNRIKAYLQGVDPAVRFVAESGMGLKRLFSEEVLLPPEYDYIEEPTRVVVKVRKDGNALPPSTACSNSAPRGATVIIFIWICGGISCPKTETFYSKQCNNLSHASSQ